MTVSLGLLWLTSLLIIIGTFTMVFSLDHAQNRRSRRWLAIIASLCWLLVVILILFILKHPI